MSRCGECGVELGPGESCQDRFHELLALEANVPGAAGGIPHFFAVAAYGVQHPKRMGVTVAAADGLRALLAEALIEGLTASDVRRRVRYRVRDTSRITRKPGDPVPQWSVRQWPMNVGDVLRLVASRQGRPGLPVRVVLDFRGVVEDHGLAVLGCVPRPVG